MSAVKKVCIIFQRVSGVFSNFVRARATRKRCRLENTKDSDCRAPTVLKLRHVGNRPIVASSTSHSNKTTDTDDEQAAENP